MTQFKNSYNYISYIELPSTEALCNQYRVKCEYDLFKNGESTYKTRVKPTIHFTLYKTDSNIYLFNNFSAVFSTSYMNPKEMILQNINKVILIDIKNTYIQRLDKMFADDKDVILFKKPYKSTNGSSMVLVILDLTKVYKKNNAQLLKK